MLAAISRQYVADALAAGPAVPAIPRGEPSELAALDDPIEQHHFTRISSGPGGTRAESSLALSGLHCAACAGLIRAALLGVPGVLTAEVSAAAQRATVHWDPARTSASALVAAIRAAGYDAAPDAAAPARALRRAESRLALWRLFVAAFCSMQIMMLATPVYVSAPGDLSADLKRLLEAASWLLCLPVLVFSATPLFSGAWRALRRGRIGMDLPVALGIGVAFVASSGAAFAPGSVFGHEVYFDSLTMFVAFLLAGRFVEMRLRHRAAEALEASLAQLPPTACRLDDDGRAGIVSVHRLHAGDRVRVATGEAFPADGALLAGTTSADEALISGESAPVPKRAGDTLLAGSMNCGAPCLMRVERTGADTRFEAILSMMRSAAAQRPAAARAAERWAGPFVFAVLLLAAGAAAAWSLVDPARAVWVAVSVLIVTCPCALSLAAPATLVAAARGMARRGITLQRLDAIEALAGVQQIFFDKTGTLSSECMALRDVRLAAAAGGTGMDSGQALRAAAGLAQWSSHPLSKAIVAAAGPERVGPVFEGVEEQPGQGLRGRDVQGREWRLGSAQWVGVTDESAGLWLGRDARPMACFTFDESLREGAAQAVQALRADGLRLTLLSGDSAERARALAGRVRIDEVIAPATPEGKLAAIEAAQRAGRRVAMVGDGINDAPVLARADVSIAMGQGALVARAQADAVLASGSLHDLVAARRVAQRAMRIVRQNIAWAALYNLACIPLALAGALPPWAAGLGMAGSSLAVVLNAARVAR